MGRAAPAGRAPRRRRFGQHFLHDPAVIRRIARALGAHPGDHLVEIGPGRGALTRELLSLPDCTLDAIEIDRDLVRELRHRLRRSTAPRAALGGRARVRFRAARARARRPAAHRRQPALQHLDAAAVSPARSRRGHRRHARYVATGGRGAARGAAGRAGLRPAGGHARATRGGRAAVRPGTRSLSAAAAGLVGGGAAGGAAGAVVFRECALRARWSQRPSASAARRCATRSAACSRASRSALAARTRGRGRRPSPRRDSTPSRRPSTARARRARLKRTR